jgi:hypothetical protein
MDVEMALDEPGPGHDDEIVATVADEDAARPLVESLLLAGVGPSLKPVPDGLAVCVVTGEGDRARRVLGLADEELTAASGSLDPTSSHPDRTAGTSARRAAASSAPVTVGGARNWSTVQVLGLFLLALVIIPAIAFFVSFKLAGG